MIWENTGVVTADGRDIQMIQSGGWWALRMPDDSESAILLLDLCEDPEKITGANGQVYLTREMALKAATKIEARRSYEKRILSPQYCANPIIDLAPDVFGLFAREVQPNRYVIYAAEGEGFGAGEPWESIYPDDFDIESEPDLRAFTLSALQTHNAHAEIVDDAPDDLVVAIFDDVRNPPELISPQTIEDDDLEDRLQGAENGDVVASAVDWKTL